MRWDVQRAGKERSEGYTLALPCGLTSAVFSFSPERRKIMSTLMLLILIHGDFGMIPEYSMPAGGNA